MNNLFFCFYLIVHLLFILLFFQSRTYLLAAIWLSRTPSKRQLTVLSFIQNMIHVSCYKYLSIMDAVKSFLCKSHPTMDPWCKGVQKIVLKIFYCFLKMLFIHLSTSCIGCLLFRWLSPAGLRWVFGVLNLDLICCFDWICRMGWRCAWHAIGRSCSSPGKIFNSVSLLPKW